MQFMRKLLSHNYAGTSSPAKTGFQEIAAIPGDNNLLTDLVSACIARGMNPYRCFCSLCKRPHTLEMTSAEYQELKTLSNPPEGILGLLIACNECVPFQYSSHPAESPGPRPGVTPGGYISTKWIDGEGW